MKLEDIQHKPLGIYGMGVEGKSLYRWLIKNGCTKVFCFDENTSMTNLEELTNMHTIFRSPGVHPDKILKHIGANNKEKISSSTQLFFDLAPTKNTIGVTGTKGKGTTSSLILKMLESKNIFDKNISFIQKEDKHIPDWEKKEQQDILSVTFQQKKEIFIRGKNGEKFLYQRGNRRHGAYKIWNRHYGEKSIGAVTPHNICKIGDIIRTGIINKKREGKNKYGITRVYEKQDGEFLVSVIVTIFSDKKMVIMNLYTNRNMYFLNTKKEGVDTSSQQSPSLDISSVSDIRGMYQDDSYILPHYLSIFHTIFLGGNIGTPIFDFFDEVKKDDIVVLEMSSFQLYDVTKSPKIAVLLRTDSEHLDWHSDVQDYRDAKKNIFLHQKKDDTLVYFGDSTIVGEMVREKNVKIQQGSDNAKPLQHTKIKYNARFTSDEKKIFSSVGLRGDFHQENILAAVQVAKIMNTPKENIQKVVKNFSGLPMRCELVAEKDGRKFFNDSFSTIPQTTISALSTFSSPVFLILGGSEKFSDFTELIRIIFENKFLKKIYLIGVVGERILKEISQGDHKGTPLLLEQKNNFEEIFDDFKKNSQQGDSLLMSPACASFDMFVNYKHRGEEFDQLAKNF